MKTNEQLHWITGRIAKNRSAGEVVTEPFVTENCLQLRCK